MKKHKELSKEIAEFCRMSVDQMPKRKETQTCNRKAVLHGVIIALLVVAGPADPGYTPERGNQWVTGS